MNLLKNTDGVVENFIKQKKLGATRVDTGSFTLNRVRALELAKTLQLPERRAYILKLVQWAVRSRATLIQIDTRKSGLTFRHNGRPPTQEEFENLKRGVVNFTHLSTGIYGALGLEPVKLNLAWDKTSFCFVTGESLERFAEPGWVDIEIEGIEKRIFERSSLIRSFFQKNWINVSVTGPLQRLIIDSAGLANLEAALVRTFCQLCYVPIQVNGTFINSLFGAALGRLTPKWTDGQLVLERKTNIITAGAFLYYCFSHRAGQILCPVRPVPHKGHIKVRNKWFRYLKTSSVMPNQIDIPPDSEGLIWLEYQDIPCTRPVPTDGGSEVSQHVAGSGWSHCR